MSARHFQCRILSLLVHNKAKTSTMFLDIDLYEALPGLHSFTGCDMTSSFAGKGNRGPLKLCMTDTESCLTMAMLGGSFSLDTTTFKRSDKFMARQIKMA